MLLRFGRNKNKVQLNNNALRPLFATVHTSPVQSNKFSKRVSGFHLKASDIIKMSSSRGKFNARSSSTTTNSVDRTSFMRFDFSTLTELLEKASKHYPNNRLFGTRNGNAYDWITYKQFSDMVDKTRCIMRNFKIGVDDKVAIISNNRVEWAAISYAVQGLGGQLVPMYEAQLESDWKYIIEDSGAKLVIGATNKIYETIKSYPNNIGQVCDVLCLDAPEQEPFSFKYWLKKVESHESVPNWDKLHPDHLATIIYTSGTTGKPKGVELTHGNIVTDIIGAQYILRDNLTVVTSLAFLPWAHVYGLTSELHSLISSGSGMALVPSREQILECLGLAKPDIILSVPALFNRVYDGIMKNVSKQSPLKVALFHWALKVARSRNEKLEFGASVNPILELKFKLADKLVLSKVRAKLGGNLKYMGAGGAATALPVLQFFEDIGISIAEGYGLTETSPMITASSIDWKNRRLGAVGVPLLDVQVRIIDPETLEEKPADTDGEITCSGPNVMKGYFRNPKSTQEVFYFINDKKFFRTGDMGRMVEGKFLKITGRIKEQFKLENGKYVVPAPLEDVYARGPFIAQCLLYGTDKQHTVLLVVPNYVEILAWAQENKKDALAKVIPKPVDLPALGDDANIELFKNEDFVQIITKEIIKNGANCKHFEKPHIWSPLVQPFTQENHMLTPKLSLRRQNVLKLHQGKVDAMYSGHGGHQVVYK